MADEHRVPLEELLTALETTTDGLSSDEGVALMCLAEALLRVPDAETIDELIADKIVPSAWGQHLGHSSSSLVNASTWALLFTGKVLEEDDMDAGMASVLRRLLRRVVSVLPCMMMPRPALRVVRVYWTLSLASMFRSMPA